MTYINLSFKKYQISPGLASTLITLCLVPLFCTLGTWQWQRFVQKNHPPIKTTTQNHELQITGQFLNQNTILLDNQMYKGQRGYRIFTPFIQDKTNLHDSTSAIVLVDRGWIPQTSNHSTLPTIPPIKGKATLQGQRAKPPSPGLKWWGSTLTLKHTGPQRVLWLDFEQISAALGQPVASFVLTLDAGHPMAFVYPPKTSGTPALKHLGYAVQWFMMALAVLIYYWVINTKRMMSG